jgi:NTE family protein
MGLNLENTTSDDFRLTLTARYLAYDVVGSGSELRIDGALGSDPGIGAELYKPIGTSPLFVAPYAGVYNRTFNITQDNAVVAKYGQTSSRVGVNLGVNLGASSDLRVGAYVGELTAEIEVGNPGLPAVRGAETGTEVNWRYNGQDSSVIPSKGSAAFTSLRHILAGPDITPPLASGRTNVGLTQLYGEMTTFWTVRERDRVFVLGGAGTSFANSPLPTDQFLLGSPLHLGAYSSGEFRGDHYYVATAGYFRQLGRLPDFIGGPIYAGAWLENGDAFDRWSDAMLRTHASIGVIMDTLVGPVILAGSAGFDGRWRTYVGVGRIFGRGQ